jgi:hypothetical protein
MHLEFSIIPHDHMEKLLAEGMGSMACRSSLMGVCWAERETLTMFGGRC